MLIVLKPFSYVFLFYHIFPGTLIQIEGLLFHYTNHAHTDNGMGMKNLFFLLSQILCDLILEFDKIKIQRFACDLNINVFFFSVSFNVNHIFAVVKSIEFEITEEVCFLDLNNFSVFC